MTVTIDDRRAAWGAAKPSGTIYTVPLSEKDCLLAHYVDGNPQNMAGKDHSACLKLVKAFQTFHMGSSRGWSDIGYNALICQHGRLIEGRGLLTVGAQCPNYNRRGIGVQFMVGGAEVPTPVAYARFAKLRAELNRDRGTAQRLMGHRDGVATACPGNVIYAWLKAGAVSPITAPTPTPTPTPTPAPVLRWSKDSVIAMQKLLEVTADGSWGPNTDYRAQAYRAVARGQSFTTAQVRVAQAIADVRVDGSRGPATRAAMVPVTKAFQGILKVTKDGSWGPGTDGAFVRFHKEWRGR